MHEPSASSMRSPGPIHPQDGNYQGLLLVAHPGLKDPNFQRSVLFLSTHETALGAFGFVLNRPLGKSASDLLPEHEQQQILEKVPVYVGGPVGQDQLSFACLSLDASRAEHRFQPNLSLEEVATRLQADPNGVRAFVGYSGWAAGQLENELEQKAWVLVKPESQAIQPTNNDRLWYKVMNSLGPTYKLLAAVPDDPSLN